MVLGEAEGGRYAFIDSVTSDLTFVARGPTLEALFRSAADALLAATVSEPRTVRERERHPLTLEEGDLDLLLWRFLGELVYRRDGERLLLRADRLRVEPGPPARLTAELVGERLDPARHALETEVKAVTAHGLSVRRVGDEWEVTVTLDV